MDALMQTTELDQRIDWAEEFLRRMPEQVAHIHSTIQPAGVMTYDQTGGKRSRRKGELGYTPWNDGAVAACDTVYKTLAEWTIVWAETQSIRAPRINAWWTPGPVEPDVAGLPAGTTARGARELTSLLEAFLRGQHLRMRHHVLFGDYLEALEGLRDVIAPWPLEQPRARPRHRPCPLCAAWSVQAVVLSREEDNYAECTRCGHTFKEITP